MILKEHTIYEKKQSPFPCTDKSSIFLDTVSQFSNEEWNSLQQKQRLFFLLGTDNNKLTILSIVSESILILSFYVFQKQIQT